MVSHLMVSVRDTGALLSGAGLGVLGMGEVLEALLLKRLRNSGEKSKTVELRLRIASLTK